MILSVLNRPIGIDHRAVLYLVVGWSTIALLLASHAYFVTLMRGDFQPWWPSLGYSLAVFSVWVVLTPLVLKLADRIFAARPNRATSAAFVVLGCPVIIGLHVLLFAVLFWPLYGAKFDTPLAMAKPVFMANVDKSAIAYAALIAYVVLRRHIRAQAVAREHTTNNLTLDDGLWIRMMGGQRLVRFHEIDWIAAAGDYAEIHSVSGSSLTEISLASLAEMLPRNEFARIHRGTIVRLDRVREVRRLGRGDASLVLYNGHALRLSRRYREMLNTYLPL
jgi:two-component system LytT family response regulator